RPVAALAEAIAWIDAATSCLPLESVPLGAAAGRVLAADCRAGGAMPEHDRAALDGFAVRGQASVGASAYNPLAVPAAAVAAGDPLPAGMDAVVPLALAEAEASGAALLVEPVAPGENVERQGAVAAAGAILATRGTRLAARHIGLLAAAGVADVAMVRRPRVAMLLVGPIRSQGGRDSNRAMLPAAVERDGGVVVEAVAVERSRPALAAALAAAAADIVLVIGGTGAGPDDHAAAALAEAGELALHGLALRPGETAGLGRTRAGMTVVLLPGAPPACLWSYELLAGRAIRRLGGRDPDLPFERRRMIAARKIVSAVGMTEICPLRFGEVAGTVEPLPAFAEIGLMAAAAGDGFTIIPEPSEGCPQGASVIVHLYEHREAERMSP
ncbi:MAG: molybdopterin-binding protein, partial [Stellaceae bacterium]